MREVLHGRTIEGRQILDFLTRRPIATVALEEGGPPFRLKFDDLLVDRPDATPVRISVQITGAARVTVLAHGSVGRGQGC